MFLFCLVFAMSLCASVYMCFADTCWERDDLLVLVCGVCHFPIGILGQVWYSIVSIPDLCILTYFHKEPSHLDFHCLQMYDRISLMSESTRVYPI